VYDVDFFLEGTANDMEVTRQDVHKLNGKPYYTWKQATDKTWYTVPVSQATNDLLGVVEGTDSFEFTYTIRLSEITGNGQMWVPLAQSDHFQQVEVISISSPVEHTELTDKDYSNAILYFELSPENSNNEIQIRYNVVRREKSAYTQTPADTARYLMSAPLLPVGDRFSVIANQVIEEKQADTQIAKARALYDHIIDEMRYAKQGIYGTGDANYACDSKSGNCTEFHSYFISLARSAGIPARFAVGAAIPSERNEGGVDGYHCWAEFYSDGKWWPVDISEANKYSALATYYFGHHPANRIEFSRGRNISPEPLPASGPINFLAYPVYEIEGEPDYVETKFTFTRISAGS
jgi:transglutaminase-like putative cysteine protease